MIDFFYTIYFRLEVREVPRGNGAATRTLATRVMRFLYLLWWFIISRVLSDEDDVTHVPLSSTPASWSPPAIDENEPEEDRTVGRSPAEVMNSVGLNHMNGLNGLPQNYDKAREWFERAYEEGSADAVRNIGGNPPAFDQTHK